MSCDDVPLRELLEVRISELDRRCTERAAAQDRQGEAWWSASSLAVQKAESATEKRFDSVNEFRRTLSDQQATYLTRAEYDAAHVSLEEKLSVLQSRVERAEGRDLGAGKVMAGLYAVIGVVIAAAGVIVVIITK